MCKHIQKLNDAFIKKQPLKVYKNLMKYISKNEDKIHFQNHPLGFKFSNIGSLNSDIDFRIHFWNKNQVCQDNAFVIHNHSFDFESFILNGQLNNITYDFKENELEGGYLYKVNFVNNKSILELQSSKNSIFVKNSIILNKNDFYKVDKDEFHESSNLANSSITIIKIIKPKDFKNPIVFSFKKLKNIKSYERTFLPFYENKEIIRTINNECLKYCS